MAGTPALVTPDGVDSTPVRLLDAAERLIAGHGIEGVSLRSVNAAAGSNVAAAHYHFGSKETLVAAVLQRRMGRLSEERLTLLAPLEQQRRPRVRAVVEALAMPLVHLTETSGGRNYIGFLAMLNRAGDPWWQLVGEAFAPQWVRFQPVAARALPHLSDDVRNLRLTVASTTMLNLLAEPERYAGALGDDQFHDAIIDIIIGILTGPRDH